MFVRKSFNRNRGIAKRQGRGIVRAGYGIKRAGNGLKKIDSTSSFNKF